MKNVRPLLAVLAAALYQFAVEAVWYVVLFPNLAARDLGPIQRADPLLLFNFISELGLALLVAFCLALPAGRPNLRRSLTIGGIVGVLTGLNQYADWYGSFHVAAALLVNFWIKDLLLAVGSALIIAAIWPAPERTAP